MANTGIVLAVAAIALILCSSSAGAVALVMYKNNNSTSTGGSGFAYAVSPAPNNPVLNPSPTGSVTSGNVSLSSMVGPHSQILSDGSLRVTYPAGLFASKDGINVGIPIKAATSATLSYEVFFEDGWCWGGSSKGGKLPGFAFGGPGAAGGSGGNWIPNGGTCRMMWHNIGDSSIYIYYAKSTSVKPDDASDQTPEYKAIVQTTGSTGHNLWKRTFNPLKVGSWNSITVGMKLNTPSQADGSVSLTVNGQTKTFDTMKWRNAADQVINSLAIASFHGGGNSKWSCPTTSYARFRNFTLTSS